MTASAELRPFKTPSELLAPKPGAFEQEKLDSEERVKLALRSAHQSEWEAVENALENIEAPRAEKHRTERASQERDLRERVAIFEGIYGEMFYRMFLKKLTDPLFQQKNRKEQYNETAESVYGVAWQEAAKQFPNERKEDAIGLRVLHAYASMIHEAPIGSEESEQLIQTAEALHRRNTSQEIQDIPLEISPPSQEKREEDSGVRPLPKSRTQRALSGIQQTHQTPSKKSVVKI